MLFARRAASLLYYREIQKTAAAAKAIHISSDDKTFGDFHAKGTVLAFITVRDNPETADAFGECERVSESTSVHLPLLQNPSKVVQDVLRRRDGDKHQPAGPLLLGRQLVVGNCTCLATQHWTALPITVAKGVEPGAT